VTADISAPVTRRNVPPRTATERRLLAIWERLIEARPIGVRDTFIELQRRSALLDRMVVEIKSEFGAFADGFPVDAFIEEPTIEALARIIDGNIKPSASLVVRLQLRGSNPPLFLVHAGGGYVFFYRALAARLTSDRPVYGIRAESNADGLGRPFNRSLSVEEVAARYVAEIKAVQPRGPYSLGGACMGGVIAFEMAQQLRSQGETVHGPVLLFDAFVRNNPHVRKEEEVTILQRAGILPPDTHWAALRRRIGHQLHHATRLELVKAAWYVLGQILRNAPSEARLAVRAVKRKLRACIAKLADNTGPTAIDPNSEDALELLQRRYMEEFMLASDRLLAEYVPRVYQGSIVLLKAMDSTDPERLWTGLANGGMVVHELRGVHLDMMEEPAVGTTAGLIGEILRIADPMTAAGWSPPVPPPAPLLQGEVNTTSTQ
jgi:thioesterase domain-containing protein